MALKIKAILFGATGMVGEGVLLQALKNDDVEEVLIVGRRSCGIFHPKVREVLHADFFDYASIEEKLRGYDACFFCLGVSSIRMSEPDFRRVTYDLTMAAARVLARLNPAMTFCYVSGAGTDSTEQGRIMWARVKGKTENDLAKLPFRAVFLFRPGMIRPASGQRNVIRPLKVAGFFYPLVKALLPGSACRMEDLGRAMIRVSQSGYPTRIIGNRDIDRLGSLS